MKANAKRAELVRICKDKLAAGEATIDDLVRHLRDSGCWKIDSIVVLHHALGIGLGEAKRVVHLSPVWNDSRELDDAFHDALCDAVESEFGKMNDRGE